MSELENMSPDLVTLTGPDAFASHCILNEEPIDLGIKRKLRPVPPPLDLSKRTLHFHSHNAHMIPKSPLPQKNLPLRKRAYSWSSQPELCFQLAPGETPNVVRSATEICSSESQNYQSSTCSSGSLRIPGLPTPHTPQTPHPHSAIPVITSRFNFGESGENVNTLCHTSNRLNFNQAPLNLSTTSVGNLPSSLLSPAPSHPSSSSLNSSREELEIESMVTESQMASPPAQASPHHSTGVIPQRFNNNTLEYSGSETLPLSTSHQWPTSVWSVFLAGVQVHFVLGGGKITSARLSEELGQLERTHHQQYAPHGLHLLRTTIHEDHSQFTMGSNNIQSCQHYFRPVGVQQEDIMVIAPPDHPFYVGGKGWCSLSVERATQRYNVPCQQLQDGDICLPPYHPETTHTPIPVVTPDLTDAMKRFDFNDDHCEMSYQGTGSGPPSAAFPPHTQRSVFLSPPASPSKKSKSNSVSLQSIVESGGGNEGTPGVKSRRPMNGFMLFAKHHRLKLIQQYPGKDNRAISVLLGGMWKSLPDHERERINSEARIQAEERKRLDPDCWKRKRSHSTS